MDLEPTFFVQVIVGLGGLLAVMCGWFVAHVLAAQREVEQKRREIRVGYLRSAYLKLAALSDAGPLDPEEIFPDLQAALNDVQLFGDPDDVPLIEDFCGELSTKRSGDLDPLLRRLRDEIRASLELPPIEVDRVHVRYRRNITATHD